MLIEWKSVKKILIVRLRSIGDTVLTTPTIRVLRDFLPDARIDVLLEDWVAPVLEEFEPVDEVITVTKTWPDRIRTGLELRKREYDVAINLHGGTTAGFLTRFTGARHRIGYEGYQFPFLYNQKYPPASQFWNRKITHSAEQQAALIGFAGVPLRECPKTSLAVTNAAAAAVEEALTALFGGCVPEKFAAIHPSAAYHTKRWSEKNFAELINHLDWLGIPEVIITTPAEEPIIHGIEMSLGREVRAISGLELPQVTALCSRAALFVGNDSGIAHIAAAVGTPLVVIFGSSNINHWKPWTNAPNRVVSVPFDCQPCPGDICREFGEPRCILSISTEMVFDAVDELLQKREL